MRLGDAKAGELIIVLEDDDPLGETLEVMAAQAISAGCKSVRAIRRHLRRQGIVARNSKLEAAARHALQGIRL